MRVHTLAYNDMTVQNTDYRYYRGIDDGLNVRWSFNYDYLTNSFTTQPNADDLANYKVFDNPATAGNNWVHHLFITSADVVAAPQGSGASAVLSNVCGFWDVFDPIPQLAAVLDSANKPSITDLFPQTETDIQDPNFWFRLGAGSSSWNGIATNHTLTEQKFISYDHDFGSEHNCVEIIQADHTVDCAAIRPLGSGDDDRRGRRVSNAGEDLNAAVVPGFQVLGLPPEARTHYGAPNGVDLERFVIRHNGQSSVEAQLIGSDDMMKMLVHTKKYAGSSGYKTSMSNLLPANLPLMLDTGDIGKTYFCVHHVWSVPDSCVDALDIHGITPLAVGTRQTPTNADNVAKMIYCVPHGSFDVAPIRGSADHEHHSGNWDLSNGTFVLGRSSGQVPQYGWAIEGGYAKQSEFVEVMTTHDQTGDWFVQWGDIGEVPDGTRLPYVEFVRFIFSPDAAQANSMIDVDNQLILTLCRLPDYPDRCYMLLQRGEWHEGATNDQHVEAFITGINQVIWINGERTAANITNMAPFDINGRMIKFDAGESLTTGMIEALPLSNSSANLQSQDTFVTRLDAVGGKFYPFSYISALLGPVLKVHSYTSTSGTPFRPQSGSGYIDMFVEVGCIHEEGTNTRTREVRIGRE